jgi:hypothetical protein
MINKTALSILLAGLVLAAPRPAPGYQPDYGKDVQYQGNIASPIDLNGAANAPGSSVGQYGQGQTNSQIDNYVNQAEELYLNEDSGTVRVLRTNQKDQVNSFVTAFIPLQHVFVRELRGLARTICRKEGGDADVLNDPVRHKSGVVVVCPPHMLPSITSTLQALDHEWVKEYNDGSWYVYYKGKNRDVRNILSTLKFYRTPDAQFQIDDANNALLCYDQPCIEPLFNKGVKEIEIPPSQILLDVAVYELDTQNDLALGLDWESWKNGPGRNLFEVAAWNFGGDKAGAPAGLPIRAADWGCFRSYDFDLTTAYIDFLQVKGRARLVTKSTIATKSGSLGELSAVDQVVGFRSDSGTETKDLKDFAPFRLSDVYEFYHDGGEINPSLEELVKLNGADVIGKMRALLTDVMKLDPATIAIVSDALGEKNNDGHITRQELEETLVPLAITLKVFRDRTLRYVNSGQAGVLMTVFPVVGLESAEVAMALDVSDVNGYTPSGTPIIEHRYVSSQVELKDGQPFILGGLKRNTVVKTRSGVPVLSDIPVLGYAFGREVTTKREKEMVVMITPRFKLCPLSEPNPPKELQTVANLAKTKGADAAAKLLEVPKDAYGFDQWLGLDQWATHRMDETTKMTTAQ